MYENIDDNGRIVKCRKKHDCEWCGITIQKGERAVTRVYKFGGDLQCSRMHPECFDALNRSLSDMWDGSFEAYEQLRGKVINFEPAKTGLTEDKDNERLH